MRKLYIVDHDVPPTAADLTATTAAGATETICRIPAALAAAGINTPGYHELVEASPRRLLPKSVVQERVNVLGKLADAFAALNSDPISFGRWFAPDWPNVYADDDGLLTLLSAIGLTSDQIATVTAP